MTSPDSPHPAFHASSALPPDHPANLLSLKPGDKIGKYEIVQRIGIGGNSTVWKGYDRLLDRSVAVKHVGIDPSAGGNQEEFFQRFEQEVAIQKKLSGQQKNLVQFLEYHQEPRGLFLVMELVDGPSLEQVIQQHPQPADETFTLGIVAATAAALQTLHDGGILHRDLKPANILLPKAGGLKLADFGQATLMASQEALATGTVRYMAPEAFGSEATNGQMDIYALGMIAYELLAGQEKFDQAFKIVLRDQRNQALRWMKWHTNPRVAATPLHQLNPAISARLSDLVARMMEKDPIKRIASASELIAAIRRHLAENAVGDSSTAIAAATSPLPSASPVADRQPTARLPQAKKRKWPYIVLYMSFFWTLVLVIAVLSMQHNKNQKQEAKRAQAVAVYQQAKQRFDKKYEYAQTLEIFQQLADDWKHDQRLHDFSMAHVLFIQGHQDFDQEDYAACLAKLDQADQLKVLDRDLIRRLKDQATTRQNTQKLLGEIETMIAQKQFNPARMRWQELRRLESLELTEPERQQLGEIGQRIEAQELQDRIEKELTLARELAGSGQVQQAIEQLDKAIKEKFPNSQDLKNYVRQLRSQQTFESDLARMNQAEASQNWPLALAQVSRLLRGKPSDGELLAKQRMYQSRLSYQQGQQLEKQGNITSAVTHYRNSVELDQYAPAQQALDRLKIANEKESVLKAAEAAVRQGDFALAVKHYERAVSLGNHDDDTLAKLKQARIHEALERGRALAESGEDMKARAAFHEALRQDSKNAAAKDELVKLDKLEDYRAYLKRGDDMRKQGRYGDAKRAYRSARDKIDTPEIRQRESEVEYDSLLSSARRDIAAENWAAAKSWLLTAQSIKNTDEVRQLLDKVRQHEPKSDNAS